ncbi:hypothetical protein AgCh_022098 [Apium graveolens]
MTYAFQKLLALPPPPQYNQPRARTFNMIMKEAVQSPSVIAYELPRLPPDREIEFTIDLTSGYLDWIWHGEGVTTSTKSSVGSTCPAKNPTPPSETYIVCQATYNDDEDWDNESDDFKRYVADAEQPLFEGSKCTKLESVLKLHNWKARFGVSDKAFTDLLESVGSFLSKEHVLPGSMYEAKKTLTDLRLEYVKIHVCPNDCVLYRGPAAESLSGCPKCHLSRWKIRKYSIVRVNVPAKMMWWPEFGSEARNIRLGLAVDGCINKGYKACPVCGDNTVARYLSHSKKMCYLGHRWYLDEHHPYRRHRITFDGQQEIGYALEPLSGEEVLMQQQQLEFSFGKGEGERDVMNIEKNVCDNIIGTLLNMKYKTNDSVASRLDMIDMGVRTDLAPEIEDSETRFIYILEELIHWKKLKKLIKPQ